MKTLEQQLADYGERVRELHPPIEAEDLHFELVARTESTSPVLPPTPKVWIAIAVAAVALLFVGVIPTLVGPSDPDSISNTVAEPDSLSLPWSAVVGTDGLDGPFGSGNPRIADISVWERGFVAVGATDLGPAIWHSDDGMEWSPVFHESGTLGNEAELTAIVEFGAGLVAIGHVGPDAAIWSSADATTWSRVAHDDSVFADSAINGIVADGPGLVAVGSNETDTGAVAVVWTSVDGVQWSRTRKGDPSLGGGEMMDVTAGGPGLVAVGFEDTEAGGVAVVWTSEDGLDWSRVPHDEVVFGRGNPFMDAVASGESGLVAVGGHGGANAPVWRSDDGYTWTRLRDGAYLLPWYVTDVASDGSVFVAVGEDPGSGGEEGHDYRSYESLVYIDTPAVPVIWTSRAGQIWQRTTLEGEGSTRSITYGHSRFVALGNLENGDVVLWVTEDFTE